MVTALYHPGLAAPSFDCARARSDVEKLICSDATLAQLDRDQAAGYEQLRHAASPTGAALLLTRQREWLASRAGCFNDINKQNRVLLVDCLTQAYQEPYRALQSHIRQAGSLMVEERQTKRRLASRRVTETDSHPWLTGQPASAADAFNRFVTRRLSLGESLFAVAPIELERHPAGETTYDRFYEIHHADARLISIEIFRHHESFYGHGWREEFTINWDVKRNRQILTADLFRSDVDWRGTLSDYVLKWLRESGEYGHPDDIATLGGPDDDEGWLFDDDGGVLLYGRGERSMVGASAEITIPYEVLVPLLKPDTPLPTKQ